MNKLDELLKKATITKQEHDKTKCINCKYNSPKGNLPVVNSYWCRYFEKKVKKDMEACNVRR